MKRPGLQMGVFVSAAALLFATATNARAGDYYKWTDAQGTVHFSQTPPPAGQAAKQLHVDDEMPTQPLLGTGYQSPQQKAKAQSEQAALLNADAKAVASNCATARQNIIKLKTSRWLASETANDVRALTPEQRAQALSDAQAQVAKYCAGK